MDIFGHNMTNSLMYFSGGITATCSTCGNETSDFVSIINKVLEDQNKHFVISVNHHKDEDCYQDMEEMEHEGHQPALLHNLPRYT